MDDVHTPQSKQFYTAFKPRVYASYICNSYYFDVNDYRDIKSLKNVGNALSLILVKEKDLSTNTHV